MKGWREKQVRERERPCERQRERAHGEEGVANSGQGGCKIAGCLLLLRVYGVYSRYTTHLHAPGEAVLELEAERCSCVARLGERGEASPCCARLRSF